MYLFVRCLLLFNWRLNNNDNNEHAVVNMLRENTSIITLCNKRVFAYAIYCYDYRSLILIYYTVVNCVNRYYTYNAHTAIILHTYMSHSIAIINLVVRIQVKFTCNISV